MLLLKKSVGKIVRLIKIIFFILFIYIVTGVREE